MDTLQKYFIPHEEDELNSRLAPLLDVKQHLERFNKSYLEIGSGNGHFLVDLAEK